MKEWIKLLIVAIAYLAVAPMVGWVLSKNRTAERATLCLLVCMTSWFPSKLTLMLASVELYRGHTKGFEFSTLVGLGISLTVCGLLKRSQGPGGKVPGLWLYLGYCAMAALSLIPAANKIYGLMAVWKFTTAAFVFTGAYHAFRDETDLKWVLRTLAWTLMLQSAVCLKMRFMDGRWQVHGWFEHQNPMAMWAYLFAIPLLACAFAKETTRNDTRLFMVAVAASALLILLSVSRAALAAFVAGCAAVTTLAFMRGITLKKCSITAVGVCAAFMAGAFALDSVMARVHEDSSRENKEDLRPILNRQSKAMLRDSPMGVGWNNFGVVNSLPDERYVSILMDWDASRGFRIIDDNYFAGPLTESLYWLSLSETGYQGFLSYVAFMLLTVWWMIRGLRAHWRSPLGYFIGGVLVALALTYVHGSVERVLSQTKNLSAWLIFVGFMARAQSRRDFGESEARPSTPLAVSDSSAFALL